MKKFNLEVLSNGDFVTFEIEIQTATVAFTVARFNNGTSYESVISSNGNINKKNVAKYSELKNTRVRIDHIFDFSGLDQINWDQEVKIMKIVYKIGTIKTTQKINDSNSFWSGNRLYLTSLILIS